MIVIDEGHPKVQVITFQPSSFGYILECRVLLVVQQEDATVRGKSQISSAVVVVVACCAANRVQSRIEFCLPGDIFKLPVAKIAI